MTNLFLLLNQADWLIFSNQKETYSQFFNMPNNHFRQNAMIELYYLST